MFLRKLIFVLFVFLVGLSCDKKKLEVEVYELEDKVGTFGRSFVVPEEKYPEGFPIQFVDFKDNTVQGQRVFSAYAIWHPDVDTVGGTVAVVPVVLYQLFHKEKKAINIGGTMTRRSDGYFEIIAPTVDGDYAVGFKIEEAEKCPERFKHKKKPKQKLRLKDEV